MSRGGGLVKMGKFIRWEGNLPYPAYGEPVNTEQMTAVHRAALASPYVPMKDPEGYLLPGEEDLEGMSCMEVGAWRNAQAYARGDLEAGKFVHDRVQGKPKQQVENLNVNASLKDFLAGTAAEEHAKYVAARERMRKREQEDVVDVEVDELEGL